MSYGKKNEDGDAAFLRVDRTSVFQEARLFNSSPIQPRRCRILLTKIALLLYTGEQFPTNEATTLFFGISKLFQNKDASLRQMVHLVIKELAKSAEDIIMVTSTIMKDTGGGKDSIYRPNAIRALCRIIDASTVQSIERVMKTAIVDRNPSVSSAALVSSYHLLPIARDVVRRWQNETQEAASSSKSSGGYSLGFSSGSQIPTNSSTMTQYHAIGLLCQMRMHDKMALVKMVQQFGAAGAIKSPAATLLLVRLAAQLADEDANLRKPMMQLFDGWLRHKSEMVNFEAAKAICDMRDVTDAEVTQAIHILQMFLTSPRAVTKFAAIRILHNFASLKPNVVQSCNPDIELLISNTNRPIATYAITTLLKTGNENSVDRLMKQISGFMTDITDEFKITIVEAIRVLCLKFPNKQSGMLTFLSGILRDEGGYEFKKAVIESMFDLIKFVPDSKEDALAYLCEFIEDCEFTKLAVRILHLLGLEGPKTSQPTKYIRYIYNRVVLENAIVRAAAVTALAKFGIGQKDSEVKRSVSVLLTRCLDDVDDEVRDRAAMNLRLMSENDDTVNRFVSNENSFALQSFEHQLVMYITADDKSVFESPFDISTIPVVTKEQAYGEDRTKKLNISTPSIKSLKPAPAAHVISKSENLASTTAAAQKHQQELLLIPEIESYGDLLKSSSVVELTESETGQSGGMPGSRHNSGPIPPVLPTTGLITSGPLDSRGAPRRGSGSTEATGSGKPQTAMAKNPAVTYLRQEDGRSFSSSAFALSGCWGRKSMVDFIDEYPDAELRTAKNGQFVKVSGVVTCGNVPLESSFQGVPRCVYTSTSLYEYRGWGSKPANPTHRRFTWGLRSMERQVADFYISDFQSGLRALVKTGYGARVTPYVEESSVVEVDQSNIDSSPQFIRWLSERKISSDDRVMRLKEGYIKEGSTVSVMGIVQRHNNVLMIVPPSEPVPTGCQWTRCLLPVSLEGIVIRGEDPSTLDAIPV